MKTTLFAILCLFLMMASCDHDKGKIKSTQWSTIDSLNNSLQDIQSAAVLPGFVVSVFSQDTVLHQRGYGKMDIENKLPYRPESIQIIASVTKTLVGVALMKAVEQGLVNLDDPINDIIPYQVYNPNYPDTAITLRMLAAHTSSIAGTKNSDKGYRFDTPLLNEHFPKAYEALLPVYNETEALPMSAFVRRKLSEEGPWYEKEIFTEHLPGTHYDYSNLGIALLARAIEIKTDTSFADFTQKHILDPLQMNNSYWDLNRVPEDLQVSYYNEIKNLVPDYYIITYPDGGLYSSIADMTLFLQEMMRGYQGKSELLSKASFQEMMSVQFEGEDLFDGICWDLSFDGLIGHSGNDFGTATLMYFNPETGIGRILFTNISIETEEQEDAFYGIFNTLFTYDFQGV